MSRAVRWAIVLAGLFGFANLTACSARPDTPPGGDVAAPAVSITSPASGATVSGPIAVTADASDDVGVLGVQFKRDDANLDAEDLTEPYAITLDPATLAKGSYTLTAVARDAAGNTSVSAPVTITVEDPPPASTPYDGTPFAIPGTLQARKFDRGGQGLAYHDNTAGNAGGQFRPDEDVDIVASADPASGGHVINNFETGEWLRYTISAPASGNYELELRASNDNWSPSPAYRIELDGVNVTGTVVVPSTGGWTTFLPVGKTTVALSAGDHLLTIIAEQQFVNLSALKVTAASPADTQAPSVPTGLTGTAVSSNQINLTWNASTDNVRVAGYRVYLDDVALAETADTSFSHKNLDAGTTYNYRVSAYDEVPNHSAWTAPVPVTTPGATGATLLFKSGFEGNTTLGPLTGMYSTGAWQDISGTDSGSGFTWPPTIWGGTGRFQLIVDEPVTSTAIPGYMVNELQTVTGRGGASTRALYSTVLKSVGGANQNTVATQNVFHVLPGATGQGDLYVSYWLKFQPDLLANMTVNNWAGRVVTDWKTGGDYRIVFSVYGDRSNNRLYWSIKGDNVANGGLPQQIFWELSNTAVPVPVGQWFRVEIFVHRSGGTGGRVWVAVNGQQLFDRLGSNMGINNLPWNRIMPFLNYSSYALLPAYQWVDDFELWDGFPSTASPH